MNDLQQFVSELAAFKAEQLDEAIYEALRGYAFVDVRARKDMHAQLRQELVFSRGEFFGPQGTALAEYVASKYESRPDLHAKLAE